MKDEEIPMFKAEKTKQKYIKLDPNGFFIIEIIKDKIRVEFYSNVYKNNRIVSGKLKKIFIGDKADAICDTIAREITNIRPEHYLYLGRELIKAQYALEKNSKYIQGGC